MKILFDKKKMIETLTPAMGAVSNKNTFSATEGVLIDASSDTFFRIYTSDMEKGVRAEMDAQVLQQGKYIINAQRFFQIIKLMPGDRISLEVDNTLNATIKSGSSSFSLHALKGEDFPVFPEMSSLHKITVKQAMLKNIINRISFAIATDDQRPMLCGAYFKIHDGSITAVACDSFTLAKYEVGVESDVNASFIVPGKALAELQKMLSDGDEDILISLARKHVVFFLKDLMFFTRLIDSEYIDYMRIIPTECATEVEIDRADMLSSLERASLVSEDKSVSGISSFVKCTFEGESLKVTSTSVNSKIYEEIPCEKRGNDLIIGFNCRYLVNTLRVIPTDRVKLKLISPLMSMTITPSDAENDEKNRFLYMVLPVRMKE